MVPYSADIRSEPRLGLERSVLAQKHEAVDRDDARAWWDAEYAKTPATVAQRVHILSGAIFPIFDKIMGSSGIQSVKIARAVLGIGAPPAEATPGEILGLLAGGAIIELDNGWRLTTARVAGDEVVEVILKGVPANREELRRHGLSEEIIGYKCRWFALADVAHSVLAGLLSQRRAIREATGAAA